MNIKGYHVEMTSQERDLFLSTIKDYNTYLEFGMGGSTCDALLFSNVMVYTVESDNKYINTVRSTKALQSIDWGRIHIHHVDLGPTKIWGQPIDKKYISNFYRYSTDIFLMNPNIKFDVILVDGCFRVACVLSAILYSPDSVIIIHDYWNRPKYHVCNQFLDAVGRGGSLGIFKIKPDIDIHYVKQLYEKYKLLPKDE